VGEGKRIESCTADDCQPGGVWARHEDPPECFRSYTRPEQEYSFRILLNPAAAIINEDDGIWSVYRCVRAMTN
jgi:hypothetical protein